VVNEYAEAMKAGSEFPPVVVFHDGETHWLADGYHRHAAATSAKAETITADVRQGALRDAVLYAAGANATHGLRRTNDDKRRAVETLLRDAEWSQWSDNEIARRCGVSQPFVSAQRRQVAIWQNKIHQAPPTSGQRRINSKLLKSPEVQELAKQAQAPIRQVRRGKTQYEMDTSKIGQREIPIHRIDPDGSEPEPPSETVAAAPLESVKELRPLYERFGALLQRLERCAQAVDIEESDIDTLIELAREITETKYVLMHERKVALGEVVRMKIPGILKPRARRKAQQSS